MNPAGRERFFGGALAVGTAVTVVAVLALGAVAYGMPASHWSLWGAGVKGARHFAGALGLTPPVVDAATFGGRLRLCLALAWLGYAAAVLAAFSGARVRPRTLLALVAATAAAMALLFPPALSIDSYAYAAYARMPLVHGLNPYTHSQLVLRGLGDPVAPFLQWDLGSPYGPLWTLLSMGLLAPLVNAPVFAQVVVFKLLAAGALVALCALGGRIAERLAPGRGPLAMLALGLNPLFLVEGPGSGHNDLVLLVPLLGALWLLLRGRWLAAAALLGLSVAIKLVTLVLVPWLILLRLRGPQPARRRIGEGLLVAGAALAPVLLLLPLSFGTAAMGGSLFAHWRAHRAPGTGLWALVGQRWPLALGFAAGCLWVHRQASIQALQAAWVVFSTGFILVGLDVWYPWYFTWPLALALLRWDGVAPGLVVASNVLAMGMMVFYTRG